MSQPSIVHEWEADHSILSLVTCENRLVAGTERGDLLIYDLCNFQLINKIAAHQGSIYCLQLYNDHEVGTGQVGGLHKDEVEQSGNVANHSNSEPLLISGGSDSILKIWSLGDHITELCSVYSVYDIGDIFCVASLPKHKTVCIGAQNTTIQWFNLCSGQLMQELAVKGVCSANNSEAMAVNSKGADNEQDQQTSSRNAGSRANGQQAPTSSDWFGGSSENLPQHRFNKFFDSAGPGGRITQAQQRYRLGQSGKSSQTRSLQIPDANYIPFAHNGYVYAMTSIGPDSLVSGGGDGSIKFWTMQNFPTVGDNGSSSSRSQSRLVLTRAIDLDHVVMSLTHPPSTALVYCGLSSGETAIYDMDVSQVVRLAPPTSTPVSISNTTRDGHAVNTLCSGTEAGAPVIQSTGGRVEFWDGGKKSPGKVHAHSGLILASTICEVVCPLPSSQSQSQSSGQSHKLLFITGGNDSLIKLWDISAFRDKVRLPSRIESNHNVRLDDNAMLSTLGKLVEYQTVSGHEVEDSYWDDFHECTKSLRDLFTELGAETRLFGVEKPGHPIVYGCFRANAVSDSKQHAGPKRILFYGHYDVISAEGPENWDSLPFKMSARNGYVYGRGVSDNKGPTVAAIYAAAELWMKKELQNDIVFLIEGQEEMGSLGFRKAVEIHKSTVGRIDWILLSNSYWLDDKTPCLNYGLRGVINLRIKVAANGRPDMHSGVHGGVDREPALDLIQLLATITGKDQRIDVPGFHEEVRAVTDEERHLYDAIKGDTQKFMTQWRYPSFTLHRITSSGPDPPNSTVIPASVEAWVSFRIVPDQHCNTVKTLVSDFLHKQFSQIGSCTNTLSIAFGYEAEPWLGDPTNEAFQTLRQAVAREWQKEPVFTREGGSIPVIRVLESMFDAPAAQLPCGQASDGAHLNNERLRVSNLFATRRVFTSVFNSLGHGEENLLNKSQV